jgi:hypothetical protein
MSTTVMGIAAFATGRILGEAIDYIKAGKELADKNSYTIKEFLGGNL